MITDVDYGRAATQIIGPDNIPMQVNIFTDPGNAVYNRGYLSPGATMIAQENLALQVDGPRVAVDVVVEGKAAVAADIYTLTIPATRSAVSFF